MRRLTDPKPRPFLAPAFRSELHSFVRPPTRPSTSMQALLDELARGLELQAFAAWAARPPLPGLPVFQAIRIKERESLDRVKGWSRGVQDCALAYRRHSTTPTLLLPVLEELRFCPEAVREVFLGLAPHWEGTPGELLDAAGSL